MKKYLILFSGGLVAALILLELVFRLLPVSTATQSGYYIHPLILTYPANHRFTSATGWDLKNTQQNKANNFGFLADHDFVYDPKAVVLIGDSFVEANMLPPNQRLAAQLERKLAGRPVYALGGAGSSLLDYAERAKFAAEKFGSHTFIFVLTRADVREAICGSGNIHGPCIDSQSLMVKTEIQSTSGLLKKALRQSALAQYIFSQLKFDISKFIGNFLQTKAKIEASHTQRSHLSASQQVINQFFSQLLLIKNSEFIFVINADKTNFSGENAMESEELFYFKKVAYSTRLKVIDPTPYFREFVLNSHRILEVGPYDGHWNRSAVQIVADALVTDFP